MKQKLLSKEELGAKPMSDHTADVIDAVRHVFHVAKIDYAQGANILIAMLAEIEDAMDDEFKAKFRLEVLSGLDMQVKNLAAQGKRTLN